MSHVAHCTGGIAKHAHVQRNSAFALPMRPAAAGYIDISGSSGSASEWTSDTLPSDSTHSAGTSIHTATFEANDLSGLSAGAPLGAAPLAFDSSVLDTYVAEATLAELSGTDLQSVFWQTGLEPGGASAPSTLPMNIPISSDARHLDQRMLERHQAVLMMKEDERRVHDQRQHQQLPQQPQQSLLRWKEQSSSNGSISSLQQLPQQPQQSLQRRKEQSCSNESLQQSLQRWNDQSGSTGSINSLQQLPQQPQQSLQRWTEQSSSNESLQQSLQRWKEQSSSNGSINSLQRWKDECIQVLQREEAGRGLPAAPPVHAVVKAESEEPSHVRRGKCTHIHTVKPRTFFWGCVNNPIAQHSIRHTVEMVAVLVPSCCMLTLTYAHY